MLYSLIICRHVHKVEMIKMYARLIEAAMRKAQLDERVLANTYEEL